MNFANKVSVFRILSVPFFAAFLLYYHPERDILRFLALGIFLLAVISDAIDGYIARIKKERTEAGTILDPLADKALLMSAFILIYTQDSLRAAVGFPLWVVLTVISRDIIILLGAAVIFFIRHNLNITTSVWGKLTTVFQMLTIISILLQLRLSWVVWSIAVFFTVISGIDYIRKGFRVLYALNNKNSHNPRY